MLPDFEARLQAYAEVIVRTGVNLQDGQRLLITEPYELHGVDRAAENLVAAIRAAAPDSAIDVIWGDGPRLREFAEKKDWRGFRRVLTAHTQKMEAHLGEGGAFLFLLASQPHLLAGLPAERAGTMHELGWEYYGPTIQRLIGGESQWTLAPAPTPTWADGIHGELPAGQRLAALWDEVFSAARIPADVGSAPGIRAQAAWRAHLDRLEREREQLQGKKVRTLRYVGEGTDLTLTLPRGHVWCTTRQVTSAGLPYVLNLPTEEVYTAPDKHSARGRLRVARPVCHAGSLIEDMVLHFERGRVVAAEARTGGELLAHLLRIDSGSARLGEVAVLPALLGHETPAPWQDSGRCFQHPLLDENAAHHVALGESYRWCHRGLLKFALNRSLIHVDLPLAARVEFSSAEPA